MSISKNEIVRKIGHQVCLKDMMGSNYLIYACAGANRATSSLHGTFCGSWKLGFLKKYLIKKKQQLDS